MEKEPQREFSMEDEVMLVEAQRFQSQLTENLDDFIAQFTDLKPPFLDNMQLNIDTCNATTSDEICVAMQHLQTVAIENLMTPGRDLFQNTLAYVKLAFPNNLAMQKLYGHHLYDDSRTSHIKFPVLLMQAYNMASDPDNMPKLIAKGATEANINLLQTISSQITIAVQKQQKFKGTRNLTTQDRVNNLNVVWANMVLISECSKQVYKNNPAMRKLFLLYHEKAETPTPPVPPVTE